MPLPDITHLQFLVLGLLMDGELSGRLLREGMAEDGRRKSAPAFYQFMARLEDAGLVEGRYEPKILDGQPIKERWYKVTGRGESAWRDTRDFYMARAGLGLGRA